MRRESWVEPPARRICCGVSTGLLFAQLTKKFVKGGCFTSSGFAKSKRFFEGSNFPSMDYTNTIGEALSGIQNLSGIDDCLAFGGGFARQALERVQAIWIHARGKRFIE